MKMSLFLCNIRMAAKRLAEVGHQIQDLYIGFQMLRYLPRQYRNVVEQIYRWPDEKFKSVEIQEELIKEESRLELLDDRDYVTPAVFHGGRADERDPVTECKDRTVPVQGRERWRTQRTAASRRRPGVRDFSVSRRSGSFYKSPTRREEFECTGSICVAYGLESCQCRRGPHDPATKACELCCKLPGEDYSCKSSFEWNFSPYDVPDLFAKPGTPCDNYNGYCDVFQKCRENFQLDPSGPLATLRKLLLSTESMASVRKWIILHWWVAVLLGLGIAMCMSVIVRLFGKTNEALKTVPENGQMNKTYGILRPCSNQPLVKARTQALATNSSIALTHATNHQKSTSNFVRTSVSSFSHKHKPLLTSGNGWV